MPLLGSDVQAHSATKLYKTWRRWRSNWKLQSSSNRDTAERAEGCYGRRSSSANCSSMSLIMSMSKNRRASWAKRSESPRLPRSFCSSSCFASSRFTSARESVATRSRARRSRLAWRASTAPPSQHLAASTWPVRASLRPVRQAAFQRLSLNAPASNWSHANFLIGFLPGTRDSSREAAQRSSDPPTEAAGAVHSDAAPFSSNRIMLTSPQASQRCVRKRVPVCASGKLRRLVSSRPHLQRRIASSVLSIA